MGAGGAAHRGAALGEVEGHTARARELPGTVRRDERADELQRFSPAYGQ